MRRSKIYLAFLPFLFSGCIKERLPECPPATDNVRVEFVYTGDGTKDIFPDVVKSVNVYVYDSQKRTILVKRLEKSDLETDQGVSLTLEAGEYHVVCWGNVFENSAISGAWNYSTAVLHHPLYVVGGKIPTVDPLYYGTLETLVVPSGGASVADTASFQSAHINMKVYVSGGKICQQFVPVVEVTNLYPEYDFAMEPTKASRSCGHNVTSYYPLCSYDEETKAAVVRFNTLRFASDDPVTIVLKEKEDGNPMYTLDLKEFLASNGIRVEDQQECSIPVHISFNQDLSVDVTIPEWDVPNVKPEL